MAGVVPCALPPPDAFDFLGNSPKFWTRSGRQALALAAHRTLSEAGIGRRTSAVYRSFAGQRDRCRRTIGRYSSTSHPQSLTIDPKSLALPPPGSFLRSGDRSLVRPSGRHSGLAGGAPAMFRVSKTPRMLHSASLNGSMAGDFGLASFYSFASTKYWPAGGGGLAGGSRTGLGPQDRVRSPRRTCPLPPFCRRLEALLMQAAKAVVFSPALYGFFGRPMRRWAEDWALLEPGLDLNAIHRVPCGGRTPAGARFPSGSNSSAPTACDCCRCWRTPDGRDFAARTPGRALTTIICFRYFCGIPPNGIGGRGGACGRRFVDTSTIYSGVDRRSAGNMDIAAGARLPNRWLIG